MRRDASSLLAFGSTVGAVIAAAGTGSRFGPGTPKQFRPLNGRPIWAHSAKVFDRSDEVGELVVVVPAGEENACVEHSRREGLRKLRAVVPGGRTRQESVRRGVEALSPACGWILVHDAARPFVTPEVIAAVLGGARETGAAVAAIPVEDTVKESASSTLSVEGTAGARVLRTVDRSTLWRAQTPQAFRRDWLEEAHRAAEREGFEGTDDASLLERCGFPVALAPGSPANLKITVPADLEGVRVRTGRDRVTLRIGVGYDLHRMQESRPLILGGVEIAHPRGLVGHSDGDVLSHAVANALLGAVALGDLGTHFPPEDPRWKDARSLILLRDVTTLLRDKGYRPINVDTMVVAERPRIAPHAARIQASLAKALGISPEGVSVKATTGEGIGEIGHGEAIAAHAVCLVESMGRAEGEQYSRTEGEQYSGPEGEQYY